MNELKRCVLLLLTVALWALSIALNLNGHFVKATNFLYYLLPTLYCALVSPDIAYVFRRRSHSPPAEAYRAFLSNIYRYFFFILLLPLVVEVGPNLYFRETTWYQHNVVDCLESKNLKVEDSGILGIVSYGIERNELTELDMVQSVKINSKYRRVKITMDDGVIKCELEDEKIGHIKSQARVVHSRARFYELISYHATR